MNEQAAGTIARLRAVHGGDPWHGPSTLSLLERVTAEQAAAHPVEGAHSIWELVRHMTAWALEAARRARGGGLADPEIGDWPLVTERSQEAWREAVADLTRANDALIEAVAALPADALGRRVGPPSGTGSTIGATVEGVVAHHAYHGGQVALLIRALTGTRAETGIHSS